MKEHYMFQVLRSVTVDQDGPLGCLPLRHVLVDLGYPYEIVHLELFRGKVRGLHSTDYTSFSLRVLDDSQSTTQVHSSLP